jgi:hypothetical protein
MVIGAFPVKRTLEVQAFSIDVVRVLGDLRSPAAEATVPQLAAAKARA